MYWNWTRIWTWLKRNLSSLSSFFYSNHMPLIVFFFSFQMYVGYSSFTSLTQKFESDTNISKQTIVLNLVHIGIFRRTKCFMMMPIDMTLTVSTVHLAQLSYSFSFKLTMHPTTSIHHSCNAAANVFNHLHNPSGSCSDSSRYSLIFHRVWKWSIVCSRFCRDRCFTKNKENILTRKYWW